MDPVTKVDPAAVFVANRDRVRSMLARLVGEGEADDLTQEVFVRVTQALPGFRGEAKIATWIHQIARGVALDYLRSRRHHQERRTVSLTAPEEGSEQSGLAPRARIDPQEEAQAPRQLARREMSACVREYVARLAPEHRAVIEMKDLEGLSNQDIAARLGVSVDNAKIRLHRARKALRHELEHGCDFYQNDTGALACDRKKTNGKITKSVSPGQRISSKEVSPIACTSRARVGRQNKQGKTSMNTSSNCGCETPSSFSPNAAAYVALGAAIGSNCEPCLRHHVAEALKLGISSKDIASAVALALKVKDTPARAIQKLAEQLTNTACGTHTPSRDNAAGSSKACGCS